MNLKSLNFTFRVKIGQWSEDLTFDCRDRTFYMHVVCTFAGILNCGRVDWAFGFEM